MSTDADIGYSTLFAVGGDSSPLAYTNLAEVTNVTPPSISRDAVDASHMQSPNAWREFISGMKDGGEVSLELNFVPGGPAVTTIVALFAIKQSMPCKITFPNGEMWTFDGIVTGFEPEAPLDDKMVATVTFKVTGQPNFDAS